MRISVVVMGVAGGGKSSVASGLAADLGWRLIEGDDFHSTENCDKMSRGIALTDADRTGWLDALAEQLQAQPQTVLTCSALKRAYRDRLRAASKGLAFVFLHIGRDEALARVANREHFFSPALVGSQFAALEDPTGEPRVLTLDATEPLPTLTRTAADWVRQLEEVCA